MSENSSVPTPDQLAILADVLRRVSRQSRLPAQDEEDFTQSVHVKLLERNYDIFERFGGRCSLRTYLTVVVKRLLLDWRVSQYGKWRPSATAVRLGPHAMCLECLIHRDGFTVHEAVEMVGGRPGAPPAADLLHIAEQFPVRVRRCHVSDDALTNVPAKPFEDPVDVSQQRWLHSRTRKALAAALQRLPHEDRQLISLRYSHGRSIQTIARRLQLEPKTLYRRYERVLRRLRRTVVEGSRALRVAGNSRLSE